MIDGEGLYTFKKKDTYNGQWERGKMSGRGVYTYANETTYVFVCMCVRSSVYAFIRMCARLCMSLCTCEKDVYI
jgi:hypothetical protein